MPRAEGHLFRTVRAGLLAGLLGAGGTAGRSKPPPAPCACAEQQYCKPLATPPSDFEVFPFVIPSGLKKDNLTADWFSTFRFDLVTTASWSIGAEPWQGAVKSFP